MATTTTVAAIRTQLVTVVQALTPAGLTGRYEYASHRRDTLVERAEKTTAWSRKFALQAADSPEEMDLQSPTEKRRRETWELALVYPALIGLGGSIGLEGIENAIRADQEQLWDAVFDADNWLAGVRDMHPVATAIEEAKDGVLVSVISFEVEYLVART